MAKKKQKQKRCRHVFDDLRTRGDWRDGTYQVCQKCGGTRFAGERTVYRG